jgi:hypothetical protein
MSDTPSDDDCEGPGVERPDESETSCLNMTNLELAAALDAYALRQFGDGGGDEELVEMLGEAAGRLRLRAIEQKEKR